MIVSAPVEVFTLRSLILKPHEKSARRFRVALKDLPPLTVSTIQDIPKLFTIPRLGVAGISSKQQPMILGRFEPRGTSFGDPLVDPHFSRCMVYTATVPRNSHIPDLWIAIRRIESSHCGFEDEPGFMRLVLSKYPNTGPLSAGFTITIDFGCLITIASMDGEFNAYLLDNSSGIRNIRSPKPRDFLCAHLADFLAPSVLVGKTPTQTAEDLLGAFAFWLRFYLIKLDFDSKRVYCARRLYTADQLRAKQEQLFAHRSEVLSLLVTLRDRCLNSLLVNRGESLPEFDWLQHLETKLDRLDTTVQRWKEGTCQPEEMFDWQLCSMHQSGTVPWKKLASEAGPTDTKRFIENTQSFLADSNFAIINSELDPVLNLGEDIMTTLDRWDLMPASHFTKGFKMSIPITKITLLGTQASQADMDEETLVQLDDRVSNGERSLIFSSKIRAQKGFLNLMRGNVLLRFEDEHESQTITICFEASQTQSGSKFAQHMTESKAGSWKFEANLSKALLAAKITPNSIHKYYQIEFNPQKMFALCALRTKDFGLLEVDPFSSHDDKDCRYSNLGNCFSDLGLSSLYGQVDYFYSKLHEPNHSSTLTWFESERCLLWAMLIVDPIAQVDAQVSVRLLLASISPSGSSTTPKIISRLWSLDQKEYLCNYKSFTKQLYMDLRYNQTLTFQFIWRQQAGVPLGVWLLSHGHYVIVLKCKSRFVVYRNQNTPKFPGYFMTEMLPYMPGILRSAPIILSRHDRVRMTSNSCRYELAELVLQRHF